MPKKQIRNNKVNLDFDFAQTQIGFAKFGIMNRNQQNTHIRLSNIKSAIWQMCCFTNLVCHVIDRTTSSFMNQHSDDLQKKKKIANKEGTQRFLHTQENVNRNQNFTWN